LFLNSTANLWFLYYLLLCYICVIAIQCIIKTARIGYSSIKAPSITPVTKINNPSSPSPGRSHHTLLYLIPLSIILLCISPTWYVDTTYSFIPSLTQLLTYGCYFYFGYRLSQDHSFFRSIPYPFALFLIGLCLVPAICYCVLEYQTQTHHDYFTYIKFGVAVTYGLTSWLMVVGAIGIGFRYFNQSKPMIRFHSDACYWSFLVQPPIVILCQSQIVPLNLPIPIQYVLIVILSWGIIMESYNRFVRPTLIGALLNGQPCPRYQWLFMNRLKKSYAKTN